LSANFSHQAVEFGKFCPKSADFARQQGTVHGFTGIGVLNHSIADTYNHFSLRARTDSGIQQRIFSLTAAPLFRHTTVRLPDALPIQDRIPAHKTHPKNADGWLFALYGAQIFNCLGF
jgi:hypothetical protein